MPNQAQTERALGSLTWVTYTEHCGRNVSDVELLVEASASVMSCLVYLVRARQSRKGTIGGDQAAKHSIVRYVRILSSCCGRPTSSALTFQRRSHASASCAIGLGDLTGWQSLKYLPAISSEPHSGASAQYRDVCAPSQGDLKQTCRRGVVSHMAARISELSDIYRICEERQTKSVIPCDTVCHEGCERVATLACDLLT